MSTNDMRHGEAWHVGQRLRRCHDGAMATLADLYMGHDGVMAVLQFDVCDASGDMRCTYYAEYLRTEFEGTP